MNGSHGPKPSSSKRRTTRIETRSGACGNRLPKPWAAGWTVSPCCRAGRGPALPAQLQLAVFRELSRKRAATHGDANYQISMRVPRKFGHGLCFGARFVDPLSGGIGVRNLLSNSGIIELRQFRLTTDWAERSLREWDGCMTRKPGAPHDLFNGQVSNHGSRTFHPHRYGRHRSPAKGRQSDAVSSVQ
jgi:hypothetical protein